MEKLKRHINADSKEKEYLAKLFNVTTRTVFNALGYTDPENILHRKIRKAAIERGGVEMAELPVDETIHLSDGTMRQILRNGAILEFHREDGSGHIFYKGKEVARYDNVTIPQIYEIQQEAMQLR